jgi:predicted SAM-dependent methyltransferase
MRVIVGAGDQTQPGWLSLQHNELDIRDREQWARLFTPNSLDAVLSEHVLEHLTLEEANAAARNIYEFLAPAGYWRIAVPDANNPDPVYQEMCRPGGAGRLKLEFWGNFLRPDAPGHREHYDVKSLASLLSGVGFNVSPLEWYDVGGQFHCMPWRRESGDIWRRMDRTPYLCLSYLFLNCWNTSLIVDAIKPTPFSRASATLVGGSGSMERVK